VKIELNTSLAEINGIGPRFLNKFKKLGIETVKDLLWHFPVRYEDFSQIYKIADLAPRQEATVQGIIKEIGSRRSWHRHLYLTEAIISDDSGSVRAVWFNQPYIKKILRPGKLANFSGKVSITEEGELYLSNPTYELLPSSKETTHTARIVPVYPETKGLTSKGIRYFIKSILDEILEIPETIPLEILKKENLPSINKAIYDIHFPKDIEEAIKAKKRFAFEDLFLVQLHNIIERLKLNRQKAVAIKIDIEEIKRLIKNLPFELTLSQKQSLWEILKDLEKSQPMNRLLQGDVGSGKTIIAAIAAIQVAKNHNDKNVYQVAFMAPTEILARQHYQTFKKFFGNEEQSIALLTSAEAKVFYGHNLEAQIKKKTLQKEISEGKIKIIIGTHALIQKEINFSNLVFVIIDEQHRFGVEQRAKLVKANLDKNQNNKSQNSYNIPHFLSMSATPIPRTLSLTFFGDLDLSLITELPKNRKPVITKIVAPENRDKAYAFIHSQVKKGRQAFVICPRIEAVSNKTNSSNFKKSALMEVKAVKEEYEKLSKKIFPDLKISMLYGKMSSKEKEKIMTDFCFLFTDSNSKTSQQRLKSIIEAKNGLELAEKDLKIRGPGEFFGQAQTGMPDLAMKALQNPELIKTARQAAYEIIQKDPLFKNYPLLYKKLDQFKKDVHLE